MDASTNNVKAFTDAIKRTAAEKCRETDEGTELLRAERLKKINSDAMEKYDSYADYEITRLNAEKNRKICDIEQQAKKRLAAQRAELTDKVFGEVEKRLCEFVKTDEYKSFLISSARLAAEALDDDEVEILIRDEDMKYADEIKSAVASCSEVSRGDIRFGGARAVGKNSESLADNTLDARLSAQREHFLSQSGLKI